MNKQFERRGPLTETSSYPQWAQDMIGECDLVKQTVVEHELWDVMRDSEPSIECTTNFMVGIWPVIERFPGYMAQSLLKTRYGRSAGDNLARRWLVRNIRVEQNHAEYWLAWAEGAGIPRERVLNGVLPAGTQVLANWCDEVSEQDALAASVAAVNYAVEGATGEWSRILYDSEEYAEQFPVHTRKHSLRWLQLHAAYDDKHPWEALEIVCTIMGENPTKAEIAHIAECVKRSYTCMRLLADHCIQPGHVFENRTCIKRLLPEHALDTEMSARHLSRQNRVPCPMQRSHSKFRRSSLAKRLLPLAYALIAVVAFILLLMLGAMQIQIALAGFLNGESVWSKAQKQVTVDLLSYASTGDAADYADFKRNYAVLLAFRSARDKVESGHYSYAKVEDELRRSHAMPVAIPNVIFAFDHFSNAPYMKKAMRLWRATDSTVTQLGEIAGKLHHAYSTGHVAEAEISRLRNRIDAINNYIQPLSDGFSTTLAQGAVTFERLVFGGVLFFASIAVLLWLWMARRVLASIRGSEERYRLLFDSAADAIVMVDENNGVILDANSTVSAWTGRDTGALIGNQYTELFMHDSTGKGNSSTAKLRDCDGHTRPVETQSSIAAWGEKMVRQTIIRDISERLESERQQRIAAEALAGIAEGVIIADADRRVVSANAAAVQLTGFLLPQLLGMQLEATRTYADGSPMSPQLWREVRAPCYWSHEVQSRRKDGSVYTERLSISTIRDAEQNIQHYVAVFSDVSVARADRLRLEHLATHDVLTGLVNRSEFERYCDRAIKRAQTGRYAAAVLFIDLDAFKFVNDSYSHAVGDRLLTLVGKRLLTQLREEDIAGRIGGDEFTVLLPALTMREDAAVLADRMLSKLSEPFMIDGCEMIVSASIGIAGYPLDGGDAKTLIANADAAMYVAKSEERNAWRFYVPVMQADASQRMMLANELRKALLDGEFRIAYQPSVELQSGRILAAEALLRWDHPERGELMPDEFIPIAERIGLIHHIDEWVMQTVCAQLHAWDEAGMPPIRVALNVSARWFGHAAFVDSIRHALQSHSVQAQRIVLEITEGAMLRLGENTERTMRALHALGTGVAIDDFGTGYASMAYLKLPAVTYLKIDRSFVTGLPNQTDDAAITKGILAMVKTLGLQAIAEGVENEAQHDFLLKAGCDEGQGFLYSYPLQPDEIEHLLRPRRQPGAVKLRLVSPFRRS